MFWNKNGHEHSTSQELSVEIQANDQPEESQAALSTDGEQLNGESAADDKQNETEGGAEPSDPEQQLEQQLSDLESFDASQNPDPVDPDQGNADPAATAVTKPARSGLLAFSYTAKDE